MDASMDASANASQVAARIRIATEQAALARNRYTERVVAEVNEDLARAEELVKRSVLRLNRLESLPENKLKARTGLERLQADIAETTNILKRNQTLRFRRIIKNAYRKGIASGIDELIKARLPGYAGLKKKDSQSLANHAFTLIDRDALDFMINYSLTLSGDVQRELSDGIKRTLLTAITTGTGPADIVRELGSVVKDPDSFRRAGGRVFQRAQYRMELIARTEVLRAHNQGRLKFHREVGVQRLEWLTADDERTCPVCRPLHERIFSIDRFPPIPHHPQCRCTSVVALPVTLRSPEEIRKNANEKQRGTKLARDIFANGSPKDFETLSFQQLSELAKENNVSRSRNKVELLRELAKVDPTLKHSELVGSTLAKALRQNQISRKRSKSDLVRELREKQTQLKSTKKEASKNQAASKSKLSDLTFAALKRLAKQRGVSTYLSRAEVIELLNERNPKRDHAKLSTPQILELSRKFGFGRHKTKALLIRALERQAGNQSAQKHLP